VPIDSVNASVVSSLRRPQDLSKFIAAGTITQEILGDPNTVLRNAIKGQTILQNIAFTVSTAPPAPVFGGGTANIAFLEGDPAIMNPNANASQIIATFWIETVQHKLQVPILKRGQAPIKSPRLHQHTSPCRCSSSTHRMTSLFPRRSLSLRYRFSTLKWLIWYSTG
jgi:hypothetical protein